MKDGRATGVALSDGREIAARVVCSSLDPRRTFFQMVGETGWQLSHRERKRYFLARTLLQNEGLTNLY